MSAITDKTRSQRSRHWLTRQQQAVRPLLQGAVAAGMLGGVAIAAQMGLMAWLVHALLIDAAPAHSLWPTMAALLLAVLLRVLAAAVQERLGQLASAKVRQQVRGELSALWARLGPVRLAALPSASLTNQWVEQVDALDGYYARYLPQQWLAALVPLMLVALVFWLDWLAALFLLLAAPLIPLFMALVGMHAERISQRHVLQAGRMAGQFLDRVRNLTSLQLFGQVERSVSRIEEATQAYRKVTMETLRVAFLSSAVLEFFASVAIAVVAMYIGFGLLGYISYGPSPSLTLFSGLFILLLAPEFFQPLRSLAQHYHDRAAALAAADALAELEALGSTIPELTAQQPGGDANGITVQNLQLGYVGRGLILRDVNLSIKAGEVVALVGPSGSGKSSLLHCLAGFIQPDAGHISLFGRPPGEQPLAWMGQRPFLIKGSWADNLRLTAPHADAAALQRALAAVGLSKLLAAQPQGLDSLLDESGRGLSGGQAQRLALARVWLNDAVLVLLDEPTASLDEESEADVVKALQALAAAGRTVVIATHHPALMHMADRVVRLNNGALADD
ncbi:thiol reductant ABC exporter subunit CydD [Pseudomonas defluvii]|uniref:thiol reductant ABC exporter subunit CydD n=1 Tax=Pseudomonas defluvii TaxID=1876757 RepID=UPI000B2F9414|nr:thiol reductant ABC exporter subunit CydD [Pseudomonas defluvii]